MNKSQRILPTVLPTILRVPPCAHLEPKILSNLLYLQAKNWQNSHFWRDQAYSNGHLCRDQVLRCWWLKYQQAIKRYVCVFFLMMGRVGREVSGRWEGREVESFQLGAQTSQSIVSQTLGMRTGWRLSTEPWRFLSTEDFWTLYPTGEEEKDLVFLCVWEVPAWERGDVGMVAMCNNQIPLLMFDNWIFKPHRFLFLLWPKFGQADKNSQGVKEHTIETDVPNLNHWNYCLTYISHNQNIQ